ncbi:MAG: hypothetical protein AUH92_04660 [Acidobacteria bacterium 13_1_40CM_4_69_4]|nr:MAG: hypothetical protein AUH92_04660 [Acidobacteria bacterium 13_1_40CM_4_69_4]
MMTKKSALVLLIGAVLIATAFAATSGVQKPAVTVGDFAVKLTKALGKSATDQRTAAAALKSLGVQIGNDLGAGLTEGVAARILGELGLRTTAGRPDGPVSVRQADQFAALAGLGASASSGLPASTALPIQCLEERNRGQCENCCKDALAAQGIVDNNGCTVFCHAVLPPGKSSPDEPQP